MLAVEVLKIPSLGTEDIGYAVEWACMILLPNYCFLRCLTDLYLNHQTLASCQSFGEDLMGTLEASCDLVASMDRTQSCCKGA